MRQYLHYPDDTIYIAGPACFYYGGYALWHALRGKAEFLGFKVTMPTTNALNLTHEDLRLNAHEIFNNCARAMNDATAVIADLESFRGHEPDGGSLFELGMGYARGLRLYGYTRDRRPLIHKLPVAALVNDRVVDDHGDDLPYCELPFCPSLMASTKIFEGDFENALQMLQIDIDMSKKAVAWPTAQPAQEEIASVPGSVYLFSAKVFSKDKESYFARAKEAYAAAGINLVTPLDALPGEPVCDSADPLVKAHFLFERWQRQVRACETFVVDLNDFNGMEPSGDASILAGMAWQLGKKCIGYMDDTRRMRDRIPHYGPERDNKDQFGNDVENFNYPINLMFSAAMPIVEGDFTATLGELTK